MGDDEQLKDVKYVPADAARTDDLLSRFKVDGLGSIEMTREAQMRLRAALQDATGLYFPGEFEFEEHNTPANHDPIQGTKTGMDGFPFHDDKCYHWPGQHPSHPYRPVKETVQKEDPELTARIRAILSPMLDISPFSDCRRAGYAGVLYNTPINPGADPYSDWRNVAPEVDGIGTKMAGDLRAHMTEVERDLSDRARQSAEAGRPYSSIQEEDPEQVRRVMEIIRNLDASMFGPVDFSVSHGFVGYHPPVDLALNPETGSYGMPKPVEMTPHIIPGSEMGRIPYPGFRERLEGESFADYASDYASAAIHDLAVKLREKRQGQQGPDSESQ